MSEDTDGCAGMCDWPVGSHSRRCGQHRSIEPERLEVCVTDRTAHQIRFLMKEGQTSATDIVRQMAEVFTHLYQEQKLGTEISLINDKNKTATTLNITLGLGDVDGR